MSTSPQPADLSGKQQVIVKSVGLGLQLLPFFVTSIETLFGRHNGQTKKEAVTQLFNASILGAAAGYGLAGDSSTAALLQTFQPLGSAAIDTIAGTMYPSGSTAPTVVSAGQ